MNKRIDRLAGFLLMLTLSCSFSGVASEALSVDFLASVEIDDNIGSAELQNDRESDWALTVGSVVTRNLVISERSALQLRGMAQLRDQQDFDDLDRLQVSGSVRYVWQPGLDFSSPWFEVMTELRGERYGESAIRDSWFAIGGLGIGQRLTDRLDTHLGYRYTSRDPREREIFDTDQQRLFLRADLRLSMSAQVYGLWSLVQGDLTSSGRLEPVILAASTERGPDPALRTAAWQLDGTRRELEIGLILPLGDLVNLDVSVIRSEATATRSIDYRRNRVQASLLRRF